jgi:hypothetical protein
MWLIQFLTEWMFTAQPWIATPEGINAVFVLLCLAAAMGAEVRAVALVSALLYLMLVLV